MLKQLKPYRTLNKIDNSIHSIDLINKWDWWLWFICLCIISVLLLGTIDKGAYLHSDESLLVDLGRIILNPNTDWSIAWLVEKQEPVYLFSYLGTVLQELSFEFSGQYGPRVSSLIGALAAATALVGWLLARGTARWAAFVLGLVFLLDPLIVQSFTIGRLDCWAMAICLGCCWVLRNTAHHPCQSRSYRICLLLAGSLASAAIFTWPSAVFLFPLIALELVYLARRGRAGDGSPLLAAVRPVLLFAGGSVLATLLLLIPIAPHLFAQISNVLESLKANTYSGPTRDSISAFQNGIELLRVLKFTPFLVLFALVALLWLRQLEFIFAILAVIAIMVCTLVYINRVQYLVPYFIACVGYVYHYKHHKPTTQMLRLGGLALLLFWSVGLSLGVRSYYAFDEKAGRDRALVYQAALSLVGPGKHRVYAPFELYYPGRALGWKMYRAYLAYNNPITPNVLKQILQHVDYVIMLQPHLTKEMETEILEGGWIDNGIIHIYDEPAEAYNGVTTNEVRVRNLFSTFRKPYGPYRLFVRDKMFASGRTIK